MKYDKKKNSPATSRGRGYRITHLLMLPSFWHYINTRGFTVRLCLILFYEIKYYIIYMYK